MKRCFKCQCEKPIDDFYKHKAMSDGHLGKCKECTKADVRANRLENIEHYRAFDRSRASMPHRVASRKKIVKEYERMYPERKKAVTAVNNAVRDGRIKRHPCWVCGDKAVAHHPDYSRPLDVVWLCQPHHKAAHAVARTSQPVSRRL